MEIRIYDMKLSIENKHEEMELIKIVDIEMYKDLDFGGFIVIDEDIYRHCMYSKEKDILAVAPTDFKSNPKSNFGVDFVCPYCRYVDYDAWELDDEGRTYCGSCGSDIEYQKVVTVEYHVSPIKCAPVTIL